MKYMMWIMAMISDILIFGACAIALYSLPSFNIFGMILCLFLVFQAFQTWKEQGGFIAWNPYWIKRYMKNTKKIGL